MAYIAHVKILLNGRSVPLAIEVHDAIWDQVALGALKIFPMMGCIIEPSAVPPKKKLRGRPRKK